MEYKAKIRFKEDTELYVTYKSALSKDCNNIFKGIPHLTINISNSIVYDVTVVDPSATDGSYKEIDIIFTDGKIALGVNPIYIDIIPAKSFVIMRGCPGSGKSTIAQKIAGGKRKIYSSDNYLINKEGVYDWSFDRAKISHKKARDRAMRALKRNQDIVIIDNTNTTIKEMAYFKRHIKYAIDNGYKVLIIEPNTSWSFDLDILDKKNTHNVPRKTIEKMIKRYERDVDIEDILSFKE